MPQPTPQPERRRRPRALLDQTAALVAMDREVIVRLRDISELGLRCTAPLRAPVRTDCTVTFTLPGQKAPLRLSARVVRCTADDERGTSCTLGLHFKTVTPEQRAAIFAFVKKGKRAP